MLKNKPLCAQLLDKLFVTKCVKVSLQPIQLEPEHTIHLYREMNRDSLHFLLKKVKLLTAIRHLLPPTMQNSFSKLLDILLTPVLSSFSSFEANVNTSEYY